MCIAHRSHIESSSLRSGMSETHNIALLKELAAGWLRSAIHISLLRSLTSALLMSNSRYIPSLKMGTILGGALTGQRKMCLRDGLMRQKEGRSSNLPRVHSTTGAEKREDKQVMYQPLIGAPIRITLLPNG